MHRTPSKVVIPNLSEHFFKYANLFIIMLIYKIIFPSHLYLYERGLKRRAGCRQTEVQTDEVSVLRQRIGEQSQTVQKTRRKPKHDSP